MTTDREIRDWARRNGFEVGERGRLSSTIEDAYYAAHPWEARPAKVETTSYLYDEIDAPTSTAHLAPVTPQAVEEAREVVEVAQPAPGTVEAAIADLVARVTPRTAPLDIDQVREIATEVAEEVCSRVLAPKVYEITIGDRPTVKFDQVVHRDFEPVLRILARGMHVYLVGPPGTGKSTLAYQVAEALGIQYADIQCSPSMMDSRLFGFIDANGHYHRTGFRDVFEFGGVFSFEEIDNAHPGIVTSVNTALANGHCMFPDGNVTKSPEARFVATANTHGTGATRAHVGRNELDLATLDRFVEREIGIDENIEEIAARRECQNWALVDEWITLVRRWRANAVGMKVIISPRATIDGAKLLDEGFSIDETAQMRVWKGLDANSRRKIETGVGV